MESNIPLEFTFLTYNIDERNLNRDERLRTFLEQIKKSPPDIVVLQEGTRITYEKLLREMGLMGYKRQLLDIMNSRETGEMIFSKFPIIEGKYFSFRKSSENRGISCAMLDISERKIWVCTSQFDKQTALYRIQSKELSSTIHPISKNEIVIFGGDTRILEYQKDLSEPEGWKDTWYDHGDEETTFTYNSKTNLLVNPPYKDRPDRVWYKSDNLECLEHNLFGHDNPITISSHYGVLTKFKLI